MVGGRIIEKIPYRLRDGRDVIRYWVVDGFDELAVFAEPAEIEPELGDNIWWQSGRIYFGGDQHYLTKIANSHDPRRALTGGQEDGNG